MAKHQPSTIRKAQLFQAALEVCGEKGYHAARVEDIVARAGLSKGALYHHFKSKQELFLGLLESMIVEFKAMMAEAVKQSPSATEALRSSTHQFVEAFDAHPGMLRAITDLYLMAVRDPGFRKHFLHYYEELVETAIPIIEKGIARGEFADDIDPRRLAWLFFTAGDGLFLVHLVLEQAEKGMKATEELLELFLRAIRPQGAIAAAKGSSKDQEPKE